MSADPDKHVERLSEDLAATDKEFVRALEDLIYVLIDKGVIGLSDLPGAVQRKLQAREMLRRELGDLMDADQPDGGDDALP